MTSEKARWCYHQRCLWMNTPWAENGGTHLHMHTLDKEKHLFRLYGGVIKWKWTRQDNGVRLCVGFLSNLMPSLDAAGKHQTMWYTLGAIAAASAVQASPLWHNYPDTSLTSSPNLWHKPLPDEPTGDTFYEAGLVSQTHSNNTLHIMFCCFQSLCCHQYDFLRLLPLNCCTSSSS